MVEQRRSYQPGLDGYDGPECSACGGPADYVEKFEPQVNYHGQVVGYWVLECMDAECGHTERVRHEGIVV